MSGRTRERREGRKKIYSECAARGRESEKHDEQRPSSPPGRKWESIHLVRKSRDLPRVTVSPFHAGIGLPREFGGLSFRPTHRPPSCLWSTSKALPGRGRKTRVGRHCCCCRCKSLVYLSAHATMQASTLSQRTHVTRTRALFTNQLWLVCTLSRQ